MELDRFLDVLFEQDYRRLIIEGEVPEETLKEAWRGIYTQYSEVTADQTYNELFEKTKEIQLLNGRVTLLDGIIMQLQLQHDPLLIQIVNEMAIPLVLTAEENPYKKLKAVQGRVKRMLLEMQKLQKEVDELQAQNHGGAKVDDFEDWLSIMSRNYQYPVRAKDISVLQFVRNQKKLQEQFNKQQDGNRANR